MQKTNLFIIDFCFIFYKFTINNQIDLFIKKKSIEK